ncbi:MAG: HYR domain-containing protein [Thaumarchaeota archaeon]|nr:HYR domain-containing protein [Nitrososphaerota archaeon]MBI3641964.1 HYR domain-containing protein [Nitrososphaerota archaeon]
MVTQSNAYAIIFLLPTTPGYGGDESGSHKFVSYGNDPKVATEVKGIITGVDGSTFNIRPDKNYQNLLVKGNEIIPSPGEPGYGDRDKLPQIHVEEYPVGNWNSGFINGMAFPPRVVDKNGFNVIDLETGQPQIIKEGEHVKISGLYVIDYSHTMYNGYCTSSFTKIRSDLTEICFAHAEIHPYLYTHIELIDDANPDKANTEKHIVVAPVYLEFYPYNYFANPNFCKRGWGCDPVEVLVTDEGVITKNKADWFIKAPPTYGCSNCPLEWTKEDIKQNGEVTLNETLTPTGLAVHAEVSGTGIRNPSFYSAQYSVFWKDQTPPSIIVPASMIIEAPDNIGAVVNYNVVATDNVGVTNGPTCYLASGNKFPLSTTTVTCDARDAAGNTGRASFLVSVLPHAFPNILSSTIVPSVVSNTPFTLTSKIMDNLATSRVTADVIAPYPSLNKIASFDLSLVQGTTSSGTWKGIFQFQQSSGETSIVDGVYTIKETASDVIQNPNSVVVGYITLDRTQPTANPVIKPIYPNPNSLFTISTTVHLIANCSDGIGTGCDAMRISTDGTLDTETFQSYTGTSWINLPSGDGIKTVKIQFKDKVGNISPEYTTTIKLDTTAQALITAVHDALSVQATSNSGAFVSYSLPPLSVATITCSPPSGSLFYLDKPQTVTCIATDKNGNTASKSFTVTVVDTLPPTITTPSNMIVDSLTPSINVAYSSTANDIVDGAVSVLCTPSSGSMFSMGSTLVTCTAKDSHNNVGTVSFVIKVQPALVTSFYIPPVSCNTNTGQNCAKPSDIAVDSSGNIFVLSKNTIQKFTNTGTLATSWTVSTSETPSDIAVDSSGNIFVLSKNTIQKFTNTGTLATSLPISDTCYIARSMGGCVPINSDFDISKSNVNYVLSGKSIKTYGTSGPIVDWDVTTSDKSSDIAVDSYGNSYVIVGTYIKEYASVR